MTFKKIMMFFCIGLPLCTIARSVQIIFATDYSNGFFIEEYNLFGNIMTVAIFAATLFLVLCAYRAYKTPENPPKTNPALSLTAFFVAIALACEVLFQKLPFANPAWQISLMKFATIIAMAYFLAVAFQGILGIEVAPLLHTIPFFYLAAKVIFTFISISSLALISDNIFLMAGYCLLMLFFINYGKLYNKLDTDLNFRKILSTGLSSAMICCGQSAAYFIINIFSDVKYFHIDMTAMISLFALGLFTTVFTISHFKVTE